MHQFTKKIPLSTLLFCLILLLANFTTKATDNYSVVSEKDTIIGNLIKTEIKVQVGDNPLNTFKIHRVRNGTSKHRGRPLIMLPGAFSGFKIYEFDENGDYKNSFAGFFASKGYDVYGYSPRTEVFGFGDCSGQIVDCSIMKDWNFQTTLNDIEYLKTYIKKFHPKKKPVISGWSLGTLHLIASINAHPKDYSGAIFWEGSLFTKDPEVREGNTIITAQLDSLMNQGIYFDGEMEGLLYMLQLAVADPDGISAIPGFPDGLTNLQAFVVAVSTPQTSPPENIPGYTYLIRNNDLSSFKYASFERVIALGQALNPYESISTLRDFSAALAGDRTFTGNLHKFKAPVYVIGSGHGFGKYIKDNINLLGSRDITWNYRHKFGHADHYLSKYHKLLLEYPLLFWLKRVFYFDYPKSVKSKEIVLPPTVKNPLLIYPNPASDIIMLSYELPKSGKVSLSLTDLSGTKIINLIDSESQIAGKYNVPLDVSRLKSGTYQYTWQTGNKVKSGKLVIVR